MSGFATTLIVAAALLFSSATARMRNREEPAKGKFYPERDSTKKCEELCKVDAGMDADARDCMTECSVYTDVMTHHLDEGLEGFAHDESYNEKGGEKIKELHNEKAPEEVLACTPVVDLEKVPQFADLDLNKDGVIDYEESEKFTAKACIPDEMNEQIFSEADANQDKVIDKEEFDQAGEDSKYGQTMDKALEKVSEGDDEYNSVQEPPLEEFDENKDGALDESEAKEAFEHELERRTEHAEVPPETMKELEPEVQEAIDEVDTNDDGEIDGDEYVAKGEGSDLGKELTEAAGADEDAKELDDLSRADGAAPAAASFAQRTHRHNSGFLRKRRAAQKWAARTYAHALHRLAAAKHHRHH